jgi:hypothetical protein
MVCPEGKMFVCRSPSPFILSPGERKSPVHDSRFANDRPANPAAGYAKDAARVAPSPWGEGRVEGGRN